MKKPAEITKEDVAAYLRAHPTFFENFPDVLESLALPEVEHGGNVVDFQHHRLGKLQAGLSALKRKYDGLILSSRDNMSTLHQVHEAVLSLMRASSFEQLLEIVAMDLPAIFNVDVVRLGLESEAAEFYENKFGEANASGLAFLDKGTIDAVFGAKSALLVADTDKTFVHGFDRLFSQCTGIAQSIALLRMTLPSSQRPAVLAFGVRLEGHFHDGQGTELLTFLAQILEHRLDECLNDSGIEALI